MQLVTLRDVQSADLHVLIGPPDQEGDERRLEPDRLLYLAQDTALRARLAADPDLTPAACEELLRQTSSAVSLARNVLADVEVGGVTMRAGDRVLGRLPGAKRDPRVFADPARTGAAR